MKLTFSVLCLILILFSFLLTRESSEDYFKKIKAKLYYSKVTSFGQEKLTGLNLENLSNIDFSKINDLKYLKQINLSSTNVSNGDLNFITNLQFLEELDLSNTEIDSDSLKRFKNLKILKLGGAHFSNISNLEDIRYLYLDHCQIADYSAISKLSGVFYVDFSFSDINNNSISTLPMSIRHLNLAHTKISNLKFLEKSQLEGLILSYSQLSDIKQLEKMKSLTDLFLEGLNLSEIETLMKLVSLKTLNISSTNINKFKFLKNLTNLETLDVSNTNFNVSDLSYLENIKSLRVLYTKGLKITAEEVKSILGEKVFLK